MNSLKMCTNRGMYDHRCFSRRLHQNRHTMKSKVHPFLLFQGKAEEAMNLRLVVPRERDDDIVPYSPDQAGLKGSIMNATFTVGGETLLCTDSVVKLLSLKTGFGARLKRSRNTVVLLSHSAIML